MRLFDVAEAPEIEPRYNIAPTQFVPVVRVTQGAVRRLAELYWGLLPSWAKEKSMAARMINARSETIAEKPAFRAAIRRRRCLVLASGYYEWHAVAGGKQPYFIRRRDADPMAFAGIWESWVERDGEPPLESCAIVTTEATGSLAQIHHRMPVVLAPDDCNLWLDPAVADPARLAPLYGRVDAAALESYAVSKRVNNARNQGADLIAPAGD